MANRNFITGGEVPERTGNPEEDLEKLADYLYKMVEQLKYRLDQLGKEIDQLRKGLGK